jgi:hypothetical protein
MSSLSRLSLSRADSISLIHSFLSLSPVSASLLLWQGAKGHFRCLSYALLRRAPSI